jgi:4-hydroxybenzoate polyprenyltransferase
VTRVAVAARDLVKSAHPGPSLAVTAIGTALSVAAGNTATRSVLLALALLTGQLTIGWCNDAADAARDVAAGRTDKPVALGRVSVRSVTTASVSAGLACVPLSFALGVGCGTTHVVAVGGGLVYDLAGKFHAWSFVPFAVSFGLLPAVATLALPEPVWPPWWAILAGGLLGVVAHLANTLPDLDADVSAGVLGLPQRLGARATRLLAGVLVLVCAVILLVAPRTGGTSGLPGPVGVLVVGAIVVLLACAFVVRWPDGSRAPFALTVLASVVVVGLLVARGSALA